MATISLKRPDLCCPKCNEDISHYFWDNSQSHLGPYVVPRQGATWLLLSVKYIKCTISYVDIALVPKASLLPGLLVLLPQVSVESHGFGINDGKSSASLPGMDSENSSSMDSSVSGGSSGSRPKSPNELILATSSTTSSSCSVVGSETNAVVMSPKVRILAGPPTVMAALDEEFWDQQKRNNLATWERERKEKLRMKRLMRKLSKLECENETLLNKLDLKGHDDVKMD